MQKQTQEITLNQFLSGYTNELYEKIDLKDSVLLQGYELLDTEAQPNILGVTPEKNYRIWETNKPLDTSLTDL